MAPFQSLCQGIFLAVAIISCLYNFNIAGFHGSRRLPQAFRHHTQLTLRLQLSNGPNFASPTPDESTAFATLSEVYLQSTANQVAVPVDTPSSAIDSDITTAYTPNKIGSCRVKIVTFNILAPCYNKIKGPKSGVDEPRPAPKFESEMEDVFVKRNLAIIDQLRASDADIICIQEFWSENDKIRSLYLEKLCNIPQIQSQNGEYVVSDLLVFTSA